jgi:hypothetical protein
MRKEYFVNLFLQNLVARISNVKGLTIERLLICKVKILEVIIVSCFLAFILYYSTKSKIILIF